MKYSEDENSSQNAVIVKIYIFLEYALYLTRLHININPLKSRI